MQYYRHLPAPTLHPHPNFDANSDAEVLKKAMKGRGCDEKTIYTLLCKRSNEQRQQIKQAFNLNFKEDLVKQLKSELKGDLEDLIVGLMYDKDEYDAVELNRAMKGLGTDELTLTEILATRSNAEIAAIKRNYQRLFKTDLEKDIIDDTSSHFRTFLLALCNGSRDEGAHVDLEKAKDQAKILLEIDDLKKALGDDINKSFNQWLVYQSFNQLQELFRQYRKFANKEIEDRIAKDVSGDIKDAMIAIVQVTKDRNSYFVNRLKNAMKGLGTDNKTLIRVIVSRSERDLLAIKQEWERQYAAHLANTVADDTSGNYKEALMALVEGNQTNLLLLPDLKNGKF